MTEPEIIPPDRHPGSRNGSPLGHPDAMGDPTGAADPVHADPLIPEANADPLPHEAAAATHEPPLLDPVEPGPVPPEATAAELPRSKPRRDPLPLLLGVGILVLIGAVIYLWRHPIGSTGAAVPDERVAALQEQVATLQQRLATLEQRPSPTAPAPADTAAVDQRIAPLEQRLAALEKRPAGPATAADPAATAALAARVDALAKQQTQLAATAGAETAAAAALTKRLDDEQPRLAALEQQRTTLDQQRAALDQQRAALSAQSAQLAAVAGRLDAQDQRVGALAAQAAQLTAVSGKLDALATEAGRTNGVAARTARVQAATAALAAGRPLGELPEAPSALARFAKDPPPTEASLRLSFPQAAAAAQAASRPDTAHLPFWEAVQSRAEELVTVRRGDQVIVGDPAAGVIARARHALDAGDLAGAVAAVGELTGPPAAAFADWSHRAQSLLDARAALAAMAARS